jgi:putative Holliday junction resolvase
MDDTEGPQARLVRSFGNELARVTGRPVHYYDERLTSFAAEDLMREAAFSRKRHKRKQDRVAAQVLLQGFLESKKPGPTQPTE